MSCCNSYELVILAGTDVVLPLTIKDTDADGVVSPVSLVGATVYLAIKQQGASSLAVDIAQTSHTDAANGRTSITIPRATTATMVPDAVHTGLITVKSSGNLLEPLAEFPVVVSLPISARDT